MRRNRKTFTAGVLLLILLTMIVLLLNSITDDRPERQEHEITLGPKKNSDEIRRSRDLNLKEAWLRRKSKSKYSLSQGSNFTGIYLRQAYRVSNTEIRLIYLENQDNTRNLKVEIPTLGWQPVDWFCFNSTCMDYLFCSMATRIGSVRLPSNTPHFPNLHVTSELSDEYTVIPLQDVRRPKSSKIETLGVCLQPIFFFTDWTIIVQFFEAWIAQGATKFYFYLHSYTWQTKRILDFYKASLGDGLELIDWSDLPVHRRDRGSYEKDPNSRVFRHAATAFMHDCMLRARNQVKFIANTDLDDLPVSSNLNISTTLENIAYRHPHAAQFKVDWILSHQPQNWDSIQKPSDVKFDIHAVRVLQIENIRWDYRVSKKMFHRPERVIHFDMHSVYRNELYDDENQHTTIELFDSPQLFFLHLRRFERHLLNPPTTDYNNSFNYSLLMELNQKMSDQFLNRGLDTKFFSSSLAPWALEARQTMRDLEQCRLEAFGTTLNDVNEMCQQSAAGCEWMLTAGTHFIKTPQTWVNVASKGIFNSYTAKIEGWF